jgi:hypothetical protein
VTERGSPANQCLYQPTFVRMSTAFHDTTCIPLCYCCSIPDCIPRSLLFYLSLHP